MNANAPSVQIQLNGESRTVPADRPLADFIASLGLSPQSALVEHNGQALFRADWEHILLTEGDRLEVLRVVAGG